MGGGTDPALKFFFGRAPSLFSCKSTVSHFGERFRDGQYTLVSFLFAVLLLTVPPNPAICKSGGHVPPVPHGVGATDPDSRRSVPGAWTQTPISA